MWIFCCGMRRSGSTLQYQIAVELVTRKAAGVGLGYCLPENFKEMQEAYENDTRIKVVKAHAFIPEAEGLLRNGSAKALYSYRDIRDVIASLMNMQSVDFSFLFDEGMIYLLLQEYHNWTNAGEVHVSRYEEMVGDLKGEVSRLADYVGFDLQDDEASLIAEQYSPEHQKKRIKQFKAEQLRETPAGTLIDPGSLLHANHIISGAQGRWSDTLSAYEVAVLENIARNWMREHGYTFSQSWFKRKWSSVNFMLRRKVRKLLQQRKGF